MSPPEEPPEASAPPSPLAEANPRSIDELFYTDPLDLSNSDVAAIVANVRKNRDLWAREEEEAKRTGRARRPSAYKTPPPKGQLTLELIGLGGKGVIQPGAKTDAEAPGREEDDGNSE